MERLYYENLPDLGNTGLKDFSLAEPKSIIIFSEEILSYLLLSGTLAYQLAHIMQVVTDGHYLLTSTFSKGSWLIWFTNK